MPAATLTRRPAYDSVTTITIEDLTRREFVAGAFAAGLLVTACGGDDGGDAAEAPTTRAYTDATGTTVQIPTRPQRIVALIDNAVGAQLLSIGAPVVGIAAPDVWPTYLTDYFDLDGISQVGVQEEIDLEKILALEPDLVIGYAGSESDIPNVITRCREIAPTVLVDVYDRPPRQLMPMLAELVGMDTAPLEAEEREYQQIIGEIRKVLGPRPEDFIARYVIFQSAEGFVIVTPEHYIYADAQVLIDAGCTSRDPDNTVMSTEQLREANADILLVYTGVTDNSTSPLFETLPVVQAGQAVLTTTLFNGVHYPCYIAAATFVLESLQAMPQPLRSDLV